MTSIDAYIYIFIGLFGVAYPILLQVVARLDEKYSSDKIVELFDMEWENKLFRYFLISSLFFVVIWSLKLPSLVHIDGFEFLIENSASLLLAISVILLVISFFYFVRKILIYYTPSKIIPYLIARNENSESDFQYFTALSELFFLFIRQQKTNYSKTLSDYFYVAFRRIKVKQEKQPVVFPQLYYEVVYKAIEELILHKEKRDILMERRTSGEIWLLSEMQGKEISENTYSWMWKNLLLAIRYLQDDLIVNHWETCHQYFTNNILYIDSMYDVSENILRVSNKDEEEKRLHERHRFLEFHYALGGLLISKERYTCIKRLFNYTQSYPPKYELLPERMDDIFRFYFDIKNPYERNYNEISCRYPFPELSGLNADYGVKYWIMSYMAVLFLRQYIIVPYRITMQPLEFPSIPEKQGEKQQWIDGLDFFKNLVRQHLECKDLLKSLNLDFITSEWCDKNKKIYPINFIERFKVEIEKDYQINAVTLPISLSKITQFENSTKIIIESAFDELQQIHNKKLIPDNNSDNWYVNGKKMLQNKDAFSENPEIYLANFDSFSASCVAGDLKDGLSQCFLVKTSKSYLLKPEDIFKAIDRLSIDNKFVIINYGVNLDYYFRQLEGTNHLSDSYKNVRIYSFNGSRFVHDSIFILRSCDLPNITSIPIPIEIIEEFNLISISEKIKLYSSVIDLNNISAGSNMYNEIKQDNTDEEIRKSVLLSIMITVEFKWKKNVEMIRFQEYSEYFQKGIVSKLGDVKSFNKVKSIG